MYTPRMSRIKNITHLRRGKRSIRHFDKNCKDNVKLMGLEGHISWSLFVPGGMAASNARNLAPLAFWGEKQFKLTSEMISDLVTDADSVRHATLQNRAAIDFLLLAHGRGCEEFEGMCCMNLSSHSVSIHKKLRQLEDNMNKITTENNPLGDWLESWGIGGWWS